MSKIYLSPPHLTGKENTYIQEAIEKNWIAPLGHNVDGFEEEIAKYTGVSGAAAVNSGTAAIHLALSLLNVKAGDIVFCSTFTFVASANPILYLGAEPVFIDSEPDTWNMSPSALVRAFQQAEREGILPKAVIVVHLYGQMAKMDEILEICNQYNVPIIEDAAESLGSTYKGKQSGTFGKYGTFSFNGNKIITTSGGGMLISDDVTAIEKARFLASQARDPARHYQHSEVGYNYRLSNILAGMGRAQLQELDEKIRLKRSIFSRYKDELSFIPGIQFMPDLEYTISNRWLSVMTVNEKATGLSISDMIMALEKENIEARAVWKPLHLQPLFKGKRYYSHQEEINVSEAIFTSGICLPSGTALTIEEQYRVINSIKNLVKVRV
ncbi:DegT/DnrJ/EryC1/StrS family aminotransferase [Cytobacillus purgationiresistens]|uniref:Pyridoxal phosphate-dependent aminotransferase EpsN n=1 Tax=Cytobacillus purgationiresistens TaxID=863449 RepID=A0ABU0AJ80_9BACI|nr:aminotransferase class I/II-fold pyridoxal phosphate-dependent enzyme [Cytobacillus purgationiresistens]MDQ0270934.1 pyridoxal phosphate-dependent aminotransferase EpsN [Cytobacillus purgationiresistens]